MASIEARGRFVVHRVSTNEFCDLALLALVRGESRSQMLRRLVAEEKQRRTLTPSASAEQSTRHEERGPLASHEVHHRERA